MSECRKPDGMTRAELILEVKCLRLQEQRLREQIEELIELEKVHAARHATVQEPVYSTSVFKLSPNHTRKIVALRDSQAVIQAAYADWDENSEPNYLLETPVLWALVIETDLENEDVPPYQAIYPMIADESGLVIFADEPDNYLGVVTAEEFIMDAEGMHELLVEKARAYFSEMSAREESVSVTGTI